MKSRFLTLALVVFLGTFVTQVKAQTPITTDTTSLKTIPIPNPEDSIRLINEKIYKENNAYAKKLLSKAANNHTEYLSLSTIGLSTFAFGIGIPIANLQGIATRHPASVQVNEVRRMLKGNYLQFNSPQDKITFMNHLNEAKRQNMNANGTSLLCITGSAVLFLGGAFMAFTGSFMAPDTPTNRALTAGGITFMVSSPFVATLVPPLVNRKKVYYARQNVLAAQQLLK